MKTNNNSITDAKRLAAAKAAMMEGNLTLLQAAEKYSISLDVFKAEFVSSKDVQAERAIIARTQKALARLTSEGKKLKAIGERINTLVHYARLSDEQAETLHSSIREAITALGQEVTA